MGDTTGAAYRESNALCCDVSFACMVVRLVSGAAESLEITHSVCRAVVIAPRAGGNGGEQKDHEEPHHGADSTVQHQVPIMITRSGPLAESEMGLDEPTRPIYAIATGASPRAQVRENALLCALAKRPV